MLCTCNVTLRRVRATVVESEKLGVLEYYTTGLCVFIAIGTQYAMGMRHIVICGLPRSRFSTLSHKRLNLKKKTLPNTKGVF